MAEHYTVLARRFRPQAFDDVVGQEHVATALRNAIVADRVAHAYLFTGARGVGKTSTARIFAKALNCPDVADGVPCNVCETCEGIAGGNDVDVLEIDGASNRGIDDIRQLRANVGVKSMRSRCKVYIIDEVHMLTKEAFNALLKTLEEPPPNVKFVFCTTEPNRVPDTILSRCQRFDFSTIATTRIADRLREIAEAEGRTVEPEAIALVARRAAGSMRDSQSLFDQLLAFGGETISPTDVHRLLGTADDDRLIEIAQSLHARRADLALGCLDTALGEGVQLSELLDQILSLFRDLMIVAGGANEVELLAVSGERREVLAELAGEWGLPTILAALQILAEAKARTDRANHARALVELALVRVATLEDLSAVSQMVASVRAGGPIAITAPVTATGDQRSEVGSQRSDDGERGSGGGGVRSDEGADGPGGNASTPGPSAPSSLPTQPPRVNEPEPVLSADVAPSLAPSAPEPSTLALQPSTPTPAVQRIPFDPGNESSILTELKSHLEDATVINLDSASRLAISGPNRIELFFPTSYDLAKRYCEQPVVQSRIAEVLSGIGGEEVVLAFRLEAVDPAAEPSATRSSRDRDAAEKPPERAEDRFAARVQDLFEATILKVEDAPASSIAPDGSPDPEEASGD